MTPELLASMQRYAFSDIDNAPESPGLYSWYGLLRSGRGTWGKHVEEGTDHGEGRSRRALRLHTEHYATAPLEVSVRTAFSAAWCGTLDDKSVTSLCSTLENAEDASLEESDRVAAPKLQSTLQSPKMRELLFDVLQQSAPVFSAPLYVGVAESLRTRLRRHAHNLNVHARLSVNRPDYFDNITDPKIVGTFAFRAARQGFSPDSLEVWILDLSRFSGAGHTERQLREVAEACEWLLNRWHRPQLGRR